MTMKAALDGTDLTAVRRGLEALYEHYLLTEPVPGRYRMHDLIREHARLLAGRLDPEGDREQAVSRLLDYYQRACARAQALLARHAGPADTPAGGTAPFAIPVLASQEQALGWARAERASLLACLDQATAAGQHARVVALTAGLAAVLRYDGPWDEAIARHATADQAARQRGDRRGQASALADLGNAALATGDYPGAARQLREALSIFRDLGHRLGQVQALTSLGRVALATGTTPARPGTCRRHWTWPARWASRWTCPPSWTRCAVRPIRPRRPLDKGRSGESPRSGDARSPSVR